MTAEELRKAIQSGPQPSLEDRVKWLEADAAAQRTAILRLEKALKLLARSWTFFAVVCLALFLVLLT